MKEKKINMNGKKAGKHLDATIEYVGCKGRDSKTKISPEMKELIRSEVANGKSKREIVNLL